MPIILFTFSVQYCAGVVLDWKNFRSTTKWCDVSAGQTNFDEVTFFSQLPVDVSKPFAFDVPSNSLVRLKITSIDFFFLFVPLGKRNIYFRYLQIAKSRCPLMAKINKADTLTFLHYHFFFFSFFFLFLFSVRMFDCEYLCVHVRVHIYQTLCTGRMWHKVNF